ncbi:hypothetical protein EMPG_15632 [Blastomyces silverae]|uniref:Uncharacterized protein n=1 Tax=Blastomyces silverae TaxID=2060906 RepID=A0A0H1BBW9_9EURO|nr:hypothetical protein EMPG_15632 [Blastomyces silverae]
MSPLWGSRRHEERNEGEEHGEDEAAGRGHRREEPTERSRLLPRGLSIQPLERPGTAKLHHPLPNNKPGLVDCAARIDLRQSAGYEQPRLRLLRFLLHHPDHGQLVDCPDIFLHPLEAHDHMGCGPLRLPSSKLVHHRRRAPPPRRGGMGGYCLRRMGDGD